MIKNKLSKIIGKVVSHFNENERLKERIELLTGYLKDAGYEYCHDESGEFWVKTKDSCEKCQLDQRKTEALNSISTEEILEATKPKENETKSCEHLNFSVIGRYQCDSCNKLLTIEEAQQAALKNATDGDE